MAKGRDALGKGLLGELPKALRPVKKKRLRKQAARTIRAAYKPALKELQGQERKVKAISEKRKTDNIYYKDWLNTQTAQLQSHAQAADDQLSASQAEIQSAAQQAHLELRDKLVSEGGAHAGTVSNAAQASAFNVLPEADRGQDMIAAERERSANVIGGRREAEGTTTASNYALAAATEAKRQADLYNSLKDIAGARQKVVLERAAKTSEEVARLLDREVTKAQSDIEMRQIAAQLALDLKAHRLNKKSYKLDKRIQTGELYLAKRAQKETERSNKADEKNDRLDIIQQAKQDKIEGKQEQKELDRKVKSVINNTISEIAARPAWQRLAADNPNKLVQLLSRRGVDSLFARAAVDLMFRGGELSQGSIRNLKQLGFKVPKRWTG